MLDSFDRGTVKGTAFVVPSAVGLVLQEVEAYVAETGLHAIRYWLGGRVHIMEVPALDRPA